MPEQRQTPELAIGFAFSKCGFLNQVKGWVEPVAKNGKFVIREQREQVRDGKSNTVKELGLLECCDTIICLDVFYLWICVQD